MAAIVNSGGSTGASASPIAVTGAAPASAAGSASSTTATTDVFTQLIAAMLGANASSAQARDASLQDLAGMELGGDQLELPTEDGDSDTDESSDEDASALAALFGGFPGFSPPVAGGASAPYGTAINSAGGGAGTSAGAIEDALLAKSADIDVTQAAIDELAPDSGDASAARDAASGAGIGLDSSSTSASAQNSTSAAQAHALLAAHSATRDADVTPDVALRTPVGTHAWKDELGTQLTWMAINGREAASLRLSPEHLGPLEVRISMREGEASVYFGAANAETRNALEQSLPRLRELFASQGLVLTDAGVSRDAPRNAFKPSTQPGATRSVSDAATDSRVTSVTLSRVGLIDTYV